MPAALKGRYDALIAKRREGTIAQDEYDELLQLTSQVEELDAQRVGYLAELARLRRTTLPALMKDLGIKPPPSEIDSDIKDSHESASSNASKRP